MEYCAFLCDEKLKYWKSPYWKLFRYANYIKNPRSCERIGKRLRKICDFDFDIVFSNSAQRVGMMTEMTFPTTVHSIDQTKLDSVNSYTVSIEASFSQVVVDQIHAFWGTLAIYALCTSGHFLTTI